MLQDTPRTDAARDAESLEDLVYRPQLALGNRQIRGANPLIAVPVTLLGYLALGFLGWKLVQHSRSLLTELPKTVAVDLLDVSEGEAPPTLAPPPPAAGGPPQGAIQRTDAPPPPIPANADAVPAQQPTELPTQDLSGVAFPAQPTSGRSGAGTGPGPGEGGGEATGSGQGQGHDARVVGFDFSQVEIRYQPKLDYPPMASRAGIQGTVKVTISVGLDGTPNSAKAFEGPLLLRAHAEAYALKWRFKPSMVNGVPVMATFDLTVMYKIK